MNVDMEFTPKTKRPNGSEPCCEPVVYPDVERELIPLFDVGQATVSHHLKKLREAGIVDSERRGLWAYYYVVPGALDDLSAWLG